MSEKYESVSIIHKYALTVDEASRYFGIGKHALRKYIASTPECMECIIQIGTTIKIKRKQFEKFLDSHIIKI